MTIRTTNDHLTIAEILRIKSLRASGATARFISRTMGCSTRTVFLHSRRGVRKKPKRIVKERQPQIAYAGGIKMDVGDWYLDADGCMTREVRAKD